MKRVFRFSQHKPIDGQAVELWDENFSKWELFVWSSAAYYDIEYWKFWRVAD